VIADWPEGPSRPRLEPGEIHVWGAGLGGPAPNASELLSESERRRAARFVRAEDGRRWMLARAIVRELLGSYLDLHPAALRFTAGPNGKPTVADGSLHFSVSHSDDVALYAFSLDREVGIDVEVVRRPLDEHALARRAFGEQEAERLRVLEPPLRRREFLRLWVRHEAALKCSGAGLAGSDRALAVAPWIAELYVTSSQAAAVAASAPPRALERLRYDADPLSAG